MIVDLVQRYWAIVSLIIAASLNFTAAIFNGSSVDLVACIACMAGLAGVIKLVD